METHDWKSHLLNKRMEYRQLVADLFVEPQHDGNDLRGHHGKKKQQAQAKRDYELNKGAAARQQQTQTTCTELPTNTTKTTKENVAIQSPNSDIATEPESEATDSVEKNDEPVEAENPSGPTMVTGDGTNSDAIATTSANSDTNSSTQGNGTATKHTESPTDSHNAIQKNRRVTVMENNIALSSVDPTVRVSIPRSRRNMMDEMEKLTVRNQKNRDPLDDKETLDDIHIKDEHSGFEFTAHDQQAPLTHTASAWIRRNSKDLEDLECNDEVLQDEETKSCESLAEMVPVHIQEEWKKTGRDIASLDNLQNGHDLMNTLLVVPDGPPKSGALISVSDDPLSTDSDSKWFQFFENASLLDEIRKDVVRTHPELYFFLEPENNLGQRRYAALERILFVWAKLNKGVRYVQGMNEIVGTIYYVLANDDSEVWACEAEADTYFLFNSLMMEMRDVFVAELDEADTGIQGRISNMTALLSLHDPEVRCHLVDIGIDPAFYAVRWLTTLLSREFLLPDTIRLWDSMFASTHKDNFIRYVCVTMVMLIRNKLLKGDFSTCLRLLQAYPTTNIDNLLEASRALWIYESQVTLACHKGGISLHQALCTITPPPSIIMAYGLPGGVARTARVMAASSTAEESAPRGFFSRANAVLGQIGAARSSSHGHHQSRGRAQTYDVPGGPRTSSSGNRR